MEEFRLWRTRKFNIPCRHQWTNADRNSTSSDMRRCGTLIRFMRWILLACRKVLESTASNLWKRASRLRARNRAVEVH
jgi:hypothetical protein